LIKGAFDLKTGLPGGLHRMRTFEIERRGIYATVHNYAEWQALADQAAAAYHAGKEGPNRLGGLSLGVSGRAYGGICYEALDEGR
jgi:hypothetical protein